MTSLGHTAPPPARREAFDVKRVRGDFPILRRSVGGGPLTYLDNAATSQKPRCVVEAVCRYYEEQSANIHRGVYRLSAEATAGHDMAREKVRDFLNAGATEEIVFVRGTTEAINLVAQSYARPRLRAGDEIVLTVMEHHSNIVPWQLVCQATGARLRVVPIEDDGTLRLDAYEELLGKRTRLVAAVHVSNSLGTINPVKQLVALAHARGIPVLLDGAQAAPHVPIDVQDLGCDFYAVSGHKMFGPTGIGALYGKLALLEEMPPYQGGGDMIRSVRFEKTRYAPPPSRFEAGTPHLAGAAGLAAAIDYLRSVDPQGRAEHEDDLLRYAADALAAVAGVQLIGTATPKVAIVSFVMDGVHPHDVGTVLDQRGICIRTGHHCTQPLMERLGVPATARASFAFYNTREEIDRLVAAVAEAREVFAG
jgi:cysteine desulfurase/selenocysteine lyase